jgi:hyperosmotically inducible periplasmic protein
MRIRNLLAISVTAAALMAPGFCLEAADSEDRKGKGTEESMGEKIDDATITTKVKMKLLGNRATSALKTNVDTTEGVVTLTGTATTAAEKELATKLAEEIDGVKIVNNQMQIDETQKKEK